MKRVAIGLGVALALVVGTVAAVSAGSGKATGPAVDRHVILEGSDGGTVKAWLDPGIWRLNYINGTDEATVTVEHHRATAGADEFGEFGNMVSSDVVTNCLGEEGAIRGAVGFVKVGRKLGECPSGRLRFTASGTNGPFTIVLERIVG